MARSPETHLDKSVGHARVPVTVAPAPNPGGRPDQVTAPAGILRYRDLCSVPLPGVMKRRREPCGRPATRRAPRHGGVSPMTTSSSHSPRSRPADPRCRQQRSVPRSVPGIRWSNRIGERDDTRSQAEMHVRPLQIKALASYGSILPARRQPRSSAAGARPPERRGSSSSDYLHRG
jgi:hypothetical protein